MNRLLPKKWKTENDMSEHFNNIWNNLKKFLTNFILLVINSAFYSKLCILLKAWLTYVNNSETNLQASLIILNIIVCAWLNEYLLEVCSNNF